MPHRFLSQRPCHRVQYMHTRLDTGMDGTATGMDGIKSRPIALARQVRRRKPRVDCARGFFIENSRMIEWHNEIRELGKR